MSNSSPSIVWPAMGCPGSVCETGELVVVADLDAEVSRTELAGRLLPVIGGSVVEMQLMAAHSAPIHEVAAQGPWPEWVARRHPQVVRLRFGIPKFPQFEGRRNLLCDLELRLGSRSVIKPSAAYLTRRIYDDFRLLSATDIHVARRWKELRIETAKLFPRRNRRLAASPTQMATFEPNEARTSDCFIDSFVDANRNFSHFVAKANELWDRGDLDVVVLTGDLVDYKFSRSRSESDHSFPESEWSLFEDIVLGKSDFGERLRVPMYTAVGNHDYRLYPYRIQIYGLRHSGIADEMATEYLKRSGRLKRFKYRFSDLNSLRVNTGRDHSLSFYYERINPFNAYSLGLKGARLVALDTGPDFYCNSSNLLGSRWRRFLSAMLNGKGGPRSTGVTYEQLEFLETQLNQSPGDEPVIVVSHAPVLNPSTRPRVHDAEEPFGLRIDPSFAERAGDQEWQIRFERLVRSRDLDSGAVFQNQLPFLELLRRSSRQVVVLSGHKHWQLELGLDKAEGQLYVDHYSERENVADVLDRRVLLLQTPALGHIKRNCLVEGHPSYRSLILANGRFREITQHPLGQPPYSNGVDDWSVRNDGDVEKICFTFDRNRAGVRKAAWKTVVAWLRGKVKVVPAKRLDAMVVRVEPEGAVAAFEDRRHPEQGGYIAFVTSAAVPVEMTILHRPDSVSISFLFETFEEQDQGFTSVALQRHPCTLK